MGNQENRNEFTGQLSDLLRQKAKTLQSKIKMFCQLEFLFLKGELKQIQLPKATDCVFILLELHILQEGSGLLWVLSLMKVYLGSLSSLLILPFSSSVLTLLVQRRAMNTFVYNCFHFITLFHLLFSKQPTDKQIYIFRIA